LRKKQLIKEENLKDLVENYNFANLFDFFNSLILLMDAGFIKIKKLVTQIMKIIIIILIKQVK